MLAAATQESPILPTVQHVSDAKVGDKRPAPDSAEELLGPSVGALPLQQIPHSRIADCADKGI